MSDSSKIIPLNISPEDYINYIDNVEKKFRKLFNNLYDNNKISKDEFLKVCAVGTRPGILYCYPKVDKPIADNMLKFSPILSAINTPGYNLAKFLINILDPLTHNKLLLKIHVVLLQKLQNIPSLDVETLFTNIHLKETINNCVSDLHNKNLSH